MTELAYLPDLPSAYVSRFRARVVALPPGGVVLDRTYFYPAGGGQPCDRGTMAVGPAQVKVVDVTHSGAAVLHRTRPTPTDARSFSVGAEVEGVLDWDRRHQHMRLHTGQHLLSALAFERTGRRTRKAVLRDLEATLDLEGPVDAGTVTALGEAMADLVRIGCEVQIRHVPRAAWDALPSAGRSGLVPLPAQVDPVRVIEIEGHDACPCGGTHVRTTREIGEVRLALPTPLPDGGSRLAFTLVRAGATTPPE